MHPALLPVMLTLSAAAAPPLEWCDTTALHPVEGVWRFTDDDVDVSIRRDMASDNQPSRYCIEVLSSDDGHLIPGDTLGFIIPSPNAKKAELRLNTRRSSSGRLGNPQTCTADIDEQNGAIVIDRPQRWSLRINPLALLPALSRLLQVRIKPGDKKPLHGLIRLYPSYDGNGSSTLSPRYL